MRASTLLTTVAALVATTAAADPPAAATPTPPKLVYLASANLTIPPPLDLGVGPQGSRAMLTISGGTVWGPRLSGKVLMGLDWGLTSQAGVFSPDAVYILQTDDGANIMVTEKGHAPYVQILFETSSPKYSWLNSLVGIATGGPNDNGVGLDFWEVTF